MITPLSDGGVGPFPKITASPRGWTDGVRKCFYPHQTWVQKLLKRKKNEWLQMHLYAFDSTSAVATLVGHCFLSLCNSLQFTITIAYIYERLTSTMVKTESEKDDGRFNDLMSKMETQKKKWDAEALDSEEGPDETDALLSKAIEMALAQGKGWKEGEKEAYLANMMDDDYIHPMFATSQEELEKSGMAEAFSSLMYDDPPARTMVEAKAKGNEAFLTGKKNVAKNVQVRLTYDTLINHSYLGTWILSQLAYFHSTTGMQLIITMNHFTGLKRLPQTLQRLTVRDNS